MANKYYDARLKFFISITFVCSYSKLKQEVITVEQKYCTKILKI